MAICNRDLDSTEQIAAYQAQVSNSVTAATYLLGVIPYQSQLAAAMIAVSGVSGAPNHSLWVQRFIAGAGVTSFAVGASLVSTTFGTSGAQTFTIQGAGLTGLLAGDALVLSTAAANTGCERVSVGYAIQALQDLRSTFGATS